MAGFGGKMRQHAVIEGGRVNCIKHRGSGRRCKSVENNCHPLLARGKDGAGDCREFPPADTPQGFQRILQMVAVKAQRGIDHRGLASHHRVTRAGARTDPIGPAAAEKRCKKRGGDR